MSTTIVANHNPELFCVDVVVDGDEVITIDIPIIAWRLNSDGGDLEPISAEGSYSELVCTNSEVFLHNRATGRSWQTGIFGRPTREQGVAEVTRQVRDKLARDEADRRRKDLAKLA